MNATSSVRRHRAHPGRRCRTPASQAVAVRDGMIAAVGTRDDVRRWRGPRTEVIDLGAATCSPPAWSTATSTRCSGLELTRGRRPVRRSTWTTCRTARLRAPPPAEPGEVGAGLGPGPQRVRRPAAHQRADRRRVGGRPALRPALRRPLGARHRPRRCESPASTGPRQFDQRVRGRLRRRRHARPGCCWRRRPSNWCTTACRRARSQERAAQLRATAAPRWPRAGLTGGHAMDCTATAAAVVAAARGRAATCRCGCGSRRGACRARTPTGLRRAGRPAAARADGAGRSAASSS